MNPVTKQDVQTIVDVARNRVMERMATRQDTSALIELIKTMQMQQYQNQQLLKQLDSQTAQFTKLISSLEAKSAGLEHEMKSLRLSVDQLSEQRAVVLPTPPENGGGSLRRQFISYA